jgi:hypothetical protein
MHRKEEAFASSIPDYPHEEEAETNGRRRIQ